MGKRVGIIVAMSKEWDALVAGSDVECGCGYSRGKTRKGTPYVMLISGIGKVNAAVTAYKLWKEFDCNHILSFGCAGGSNYGIHVGDVVVGDEYMYYDVNCGVPNAVGQVQGCPPTFRSAFRDWGFLDGNRTGLIASGDTFVETEVMAAAITQSLYPDHCPLALDMESAAIAQVCEQRQVGFTSVRVISDNPFSGDRTYDAFWAQKDRTLSELFRKFLNMD